MPIIKAYKPYIGLTPANIAEAIASGIVTNAEAIPAVMSDDRFCLSYLIWGRFIYCSGYRVA